MLFDGKCRVQNQLLVDAVLKGTLYCIIHQRPSRFSHIKFAAWIVAILMLKRHAMTMSVLLCIWITGHGPLVRRDTPAMVVCWLLDSVRGMNHLVEVFVLKRWWHLFITSSIHDWRENSGELQPGNLTTSNFTLMVRDLSMTNDFFLLRVTSPFTV